LVKTVTTDSEGRFKVNDLKCGEYFIKEIVTSKGYKINETEFEVDFSYQGEEIEKITKNLIIQKTVIKQGFQIVKLGQDNMAPLENAGFKVYLVSKLKIVTEGKISKNSDGTYTLNDESAKQDINITIKANSNGTYKLEDLIDYYFKIENRTEENMQFLPQGKDVYYPYNAEKEETATYYEGHENKTLEELFSNEDGYIKSPELPYGEYILIETSVPDNYEAVKPFEIKVEIDSRELQKMKYVCDPNFESKVKIYFTDANTKQNILKEGTKFIIENTETKELVTYNNGKKQIGTNTNPFKVEKDGIYISPMALKVGKYELKQIEIADGYTIKGEEGYSENGELKLDSIPNVKFEIGTNQLYYVDNFVENNVVVLKEENREQLATVKLNVQGEYIQTIQKINFERAEIKYEKMAVNEVEFALYAREDIYTQDNSGTIRYAKDELIREGITNENGIVYFENIEIGKYYIKEMNTIDGFLPIKEDIDVDYNYSVNNEKIEKDEWKKEAQRTPIVWINKDIIKERQKVKIDIENKGKDGNAIEGTKYGIYASADIKNKFGETVIESGEFIKTETTDKEGKTNFAIDLPLGEYEIKQINIKDGYLKNNEIKSIDAKYNISEGDTIHRKVIFENDYIKVKIHVIDGKTEEPVEGAILRITDLNGNTIIDNIVSSEIGNEITKLPIGEYYLEEIEAPKEKGYVKTEKLKFEIIDTEKWQEIILKQDYTKVKFEITDQKGDKVEEGELVIKDEDGNEVAKYELKDDDGIENIITNLPPGKYTVESTKLPEQYEKIEAKIEVIETDGIQIYDLKTEYATFDLKIQKWTSKIILLEDNKQKIKLTQIDPDEEPSKIMKVDLNNKRIESTVIKFVYTIRVTNVGKVSGYATEIEDIIPEGLEFIKNENKNWKEVNGIIKTNKLEKNLLEPGEYADIDIVLRWKNGSENIGAKENKATLTKATNKYGIEEVSNNNDSWSTVLLSIITGGENVKSYVVIGILFADIIALGVVLIRRYVL